MSYRQLYSISDLNYVHKKLMQLLIHTLAQKHRNKINMRTPLANKIMSNRKYPLKMLEKMGKKKHY